MNFGQEITGGSVKEPDAKKSLGQHWLDDHASLEAMCSAADIQSGDEVLEIGPGKGSLTSVLMGYGANVFAVEFDPEAVKYLEKVFARQLDLFVHVEQGDIRTFNLGRMPKPYKIVANIPYYLTSHLIQIISESQNPPTVAVLLVQKEVAERVCAKPGNMSLLSITAQFYWHASLGQLVPARLFNPSPKIDSQIVALERRDKPPFPVDEKLFFRVIKAGFSARRKTLLNSLSGGLRLDKNQVQKILDIADIRAQKRPQELSLDDWYRLFVEVQKVTII